MIAFRARRPAPEEAMHANPTAQAPAGRLPLYAAALFVALAFAGAALAQPAPGARPWWWDEAWWEEGRLPTVETHAVATRWVTYRGANAEVSALVARPAGEGRHPAVLYMHGRRGLDELIQRQVKRLAAQGFVVLAPDVYGAHFIAPMPVEHDYRLEADAEKGIDALLALPDVSTRKACLASHTRGGYFTLKMAVTAGRQARDVACYVSWYPHWQDPNAPEALQVYGHAKEAESLAVPTLVFVGAEEQYQRKRVIESAVKALESRGRPVRLVVYPGVGRGFDFRDPSVRTFADDLASRDAVVRASAFMRRNLAP